MIYEPSKTRSTIKDTYKKKKKRSTMKDQQILNQLEQIILPTEKLQPL